MPSERVIRAASCSTWLCSKGDPSCRAGQSGWRSPSSSAPVGSDSNAPSDLLRPGLGGLGDVEGRKTSSLCSSPVAVELLACTEECLEFRGRLMRGTSDAHRSRGLVGVGFGSGDTGGFIEASLPLPNRLTTTLLRRLRSSLTLGELVLFATRK